MAFSVLELVLMVASAFLPQTATAHTISALVLTVCMLLLIGGWIMVFRGRAGLHAPCTVPFINMFRTCVFGAAAVSSMIALVAYNSSSRTAQEALGVLLIVVYVAAVVLPFVWYCAWSGRRQGQGRAGRERIEMVKMQGKALA